MNPEKNIRPDFKLALIEPSYFVGRSGLISKTLKKPSNVQIILGGRKSGKTSFLHSLQYNLLATKCENGKRFFPVMISLQVERPSSLSHFRYLLIWHLRNAMFCWQEFPAPVRSAMDSYKELISQISKGELKFSLLNQLDIKLDFSNPELSKELEHSDFKKALVRSLNDLRAYGFTGVCFLLDGSQFITRSCEWSNDAWSYLRGVKDSDTTIRSLVGFVFSGYRHLVEYQQEIGSPILNIADIEWLMPLNEREVEDLLAARKMCERKIFDKRHLPHIVDWAGCHPYLTQQMINYICDYWYANGNWPKLREIINEIITEFDNEFSKWWNEGGEAGGLTSHEQDIYKKIGSLNAQMSFGDLKKECGMNLRQLRHSIEVLLSVGIIRKTVDGKIQIGSRIFQEWALESKYL